MAEGSKTATPTGNHGGETPDVQAFDYHLEIVAESDYKRANDPLSLP